MWASCCGLLNEVMGTGAVRGQQPGFGAGAGPFRFAPSAGYSTYPPTSSGSPGLVCKACGQAFSVFRRKVCIWAICEMSVQHLPIYWEGQGACVQSESVFQLNLLGSVHLHPKATSSTACPSNWWQRQMAHTPALSYHLQSGSCSWMARGLILSEPCSTRSPRQSNPMSCIYYCLMFVT